MSKNFSSLLLLATLVLGGITPSLGQYTTQQNFESSGSTLSYTATGTGAIFTGPSATAFGTSNSNIRPVANVYTSASNGYGVLSNSGTGVGTFSTQVDFAPVKFSASAGSTIQVRLSAYSIGNNQGLSSDGSAVISLGVNGSTSYTPVVTVTGSGRSYWDYNTGAINITYPNTNFTVIPNGNNTGSGGGAGTITITLPAGISQAALRVNLTANDKSALVIDDIVISSARPLPVTLTNFSAERQGQSVAVNWATAVEKDNAYFEVLRSNDGKSFKALARVEGRGTTSTGTTYAFTDFSAPAGLSYYRLRQVDTDGTATLSSVVTVASTDELQASFYPNPSNSSITLPAVNGMVEYRVYSVTGKLLAAGKGVGNSSVAIQDIPVGVYFLELTAGGKRNVQRFVRQ